MPYPAPEALVPIPTGIYASDAMAVAEPDTAEPLGVALIVAPWNYPVQLLLCPLVGAISAGNCVLLKSSPLVPHVEAALRDLIAETFGPEYVAFVEGGGDVLDELLKRRFDSIFFTGGSKYGRVVMEAAAKNLTP